MLPPTESSSVARNDAGNTPFTPPPSMESTRRIIGRLPQLPNIHPTLPFALYVETEAAIGVDVRETARVFANFQLRRQYTHLWAPSGPKAQTDTVIRTQR